MHWKHLLTVGWLLWGTVMGSDPFDLSGHGLEWKEVAEVETEAACQVALDAMRQEYPTLSSTTIDEAGNIVNEVSIPRQYVCLESGTEPPRLP